MADLSLPVRISPGYTDAAGHAHVGFVLTVESGKELRGEAVYDTKLGRTVIDPETSGRLRREQLVAVKRAVAAAHTAPAS